MADAPSLGSVFTPVTSGLSQGVGSGGFSGGYIVVIGLIIGIMIFSVIGAGIYYFFWSKKKWNITTRVHYENPTINGVSMGGGNNNTKRVRFKDGRVVYMYKTPIQGYTISPELLTWTRPREHDVIVTQDKKLFSLIGINSIDTQRKKLNVDVAYPDIEMDRQDLQQHIDSKKYDDPNERFKIIAKIALWIFLIIGAIVLTVLGSKTYIDAKNIDAGRDATNLKTAQIQLQVMQSMNTFIAILSKVMPESFKQIDGQVLLNVTNSTV